MKLIELVLPRPLTVKANESLGFNAFFLKATIDLSLGHYFLGGGGGGGGAGNITLVRQKMQ